MSKKTSIDFSQHSCQLPEQPEILGLERTDPAHAQKYLNHASVPEISSVKTMEQLFQYQFKLRNSLLSSDLFKKVEVSANSAATNEEEALKGDKVKVLVTVEEKSKIGGNVGVEANPNSPGQFETGVKLSLRNCFFGKGESIYFESNKDPLGNLNNSGADPFSSLLPDTYKLTASKPIVTERGVYSPISHVNVSLLNKSNELPWLSSVDHLRGLTLDLGLSKSKNYNHGLGYNFMWRHLKSGSDGLNFSIREKLGHSLKSSIHYNAEYSTLKTGNNGNLATSGFSFKPSVEFAGFSGSSQFLKFDLQGKLCQSFGKLTMAATMRGGMMSGSNVDLQDKFYLGGPMNLRGYQANTANPPDGGLNVAGVGAHVYYPVSSSGLNLHGFVTTGTVFNKPNDLQKNIKTAVGLGFALALTKDLSLEIGYVKRADGVGKCNFGIGYSTL